MSAASTFGILVGGMPAAFWVVAGLVVLVAAYRLRHVRYSEGRLDAWFGPPPAQPAEP